MTPSINHTKHDRMIPKGHLIGPVGRYDRTLQSVLQIG